MIVAKPVINKQYWILKQDNRKIGNIQAGPNGYTVTILNKTVDYKTIPSLTRHEKVEFEKPLRSPKPQHDQVHGYHTGCRAHNAMWDVKRRLPLFTKELKSKSWYAAGWYCVKQHRSWRVIHNPKLIVLERYAYQGPFYTEDQARESI